jgi:DNA invertase Pin-like site-specific DNA recombinase
VYTQVRQLVNTLAPNIDRSAGFRSLGDACADATTSHGFLMLAVFGGPAKFGRSLICARKTEGRARTDARSEKLGRRPKLTPHREREAVDRSENGDEALKEIPSSCNARLNRIARLAG